MNSKLTICNNINTITNIFSHQKQVFSQPIIKHNDEDSILIGKIKILIESLEIIWPL